MEIQIKNLQKRIRLNLPQIKKLTKRILDYQKITDCQLTIVFVSHQRIRALNQKFLNRAEATDVLAFHFRNPVLSLQRVLKKDQIVLSGDIVVSTDAARKNAKIYQATVAKELMLYVIHGILHLLGYDDHTEKEIVQMRQKENEWMAYLGPSVNQAIMDEL